MISFLSQDQLEPFLKDSFGTKKYKTEPLRGGLLNQNSLITFDGGKCVLKVYRNEMTETKVKEMHRLMEFVSRRHIPVTTPITTVSLNKYIVALYPFAPGEHPPRFRNSRVRIEAMGEMLGKIHLTLGSYQPKTKQPSNKELLKAWDIRPAMEEILQLEENIKKHPISIRKEVNKILDTYKKIYNREGWDNKNFLNLPIQLCHGDYHIMNLLMQKQKITAILDWEKAGWDFRSKEIMRSIIFNCRKNSSELNWPSVTVYLKAYRKYISMTDLERQLTFECGLRNIVFGFWAIKQYLAGQKQFRLNIIRRVAMMEGLIKQRKEYAARIAELLG